jgi:Fe(3+) dicitrate transport protein
MNTNSMKIKAVLIILMSFFTSRLFAQHTLSGKLVATQDSITFDHCKVYINKHQVTFADALGNFNFYNLPDGHYMIHVTSLDFKHTKQAVDIRGKNETMTIKLVTSHQFTQEVTVVAKQTHNRMKGVENMGIYEGKKSEVIIPDQLVANLSTNNARQVYARVAGLNIFENDGSGLQLSVGARGLDPNRTSNFNVRQNGYDISADALGYPESYYTPPTEAIEKIQIVRGAASLQYGTQFGGLINFVIRKPVAEKKLQVTARQSVGSFGFYNTFTSLSGTVGKLSYYTYFQYKKGDGWRPNAHFDNYNFFSNVNYKLSEKATVGIDITHMDYLAQQPGGLSDKMFYNHPQQSNRERNWFKVNWNMLALHYNYKFNISNEFNFRFFGLSAYRYSLGFRPNRVETQDDNATRDLIKGTFTNWGAEARFLKWYTLFKRQSVFLIGTRYYKGTNHSTQGLGSTTKTADFNYVTPSNLLSSDYTFPNQNVSLFIENIWYITDKFSITPGLRYEYIHTIAEGTYFRFEDDLAGNRTILPSGYENKQNRRNFILAGLGLSYKPIEKLNVYANVSQNYRSITFSDMQITNPSLIIDPDMKDEKGYSLDIGLRSEGTKKINYDVSLFYLNYDNKIGEMQLYDNQNRVLRKRTNIAQAYVFGVESYTEADVLKILVPKTVNWTTALFANVAIIHSKYNKSGLTGVAGNQVEFVPNFNLKYGIRGGYKNLKASLQYNYTSDQFSDATNAIKGEATSIVGLIPAYEILDLSMSYAFKMFKLEGSINNLTNSMYFTRRATGYPGPGILPSDGRSFYLTLQVKI